MRPGTKDPTAELRARTRFWIERLRARPKIVRFRALQDAAIVHELVHLKVRNHGRVFKALMSAYLPGWRRALNGNCAIGTRDAARDSR